MNKKYTFIGFLNDYGDGLCAFEDNGNSENEEETFYKKMVNESMKDVWENDKDSIYDDN